MTGSRSVVEFVALVVGEGVFLMINDVIIIIYFSFR